MKTKSVNGSLWLFNPVSKLWYSLRAEKDIFSTLNQGTGTFCFDMWLGFILSSAFISGCSVIKLIDEHPEIKALDRITLVKHRIGTVEGFLKNVDEEGYLQAAIGGLTNTLRFTHRVCVNIPSSRKLYGLELRELLTVSDVENVLCGSDLASLEDRTKQHYMWDYDPRYVKEMMTDDFDPHLDLALSAGAVTPGQVQDYKDGVDKSISDIRHNYKGGNYACTYGCGVVTLARQLSIKEKEAAKIHKASDRDWETPSL